MAIGEARGSIFLDVAQARSSVKALSGDLRGLGSESAPGLESFSGWVAQSEGLLRGLGATLTSVGGIITAAFAAPIAQGTRAAWGQVDAVEQATFALRAYETDAGKVDDVLAGLLAYAREDMGVLFQREELFAAAQGLKVMGAETDNLVDYVEIMSRSVGVGRGTWDGLNRVIGRVGATGRLTGVDFDMLTKMGYQLDESLRNTDITWEQLFEHLDRGIPAEALAGQADTIRGKSIRLNSAIRDLGNAFLGVDRDTSQFIEGGLGDSLMRGMDAAIKLFNALQPAVAGVGRAFGSIVSVVLRAVEAFTRLPMGIQTAILSVVALSGVLMTLLGTFLLMLPRIAATAEALTKLGGMSGVFGRLATGGRLFLQQVSMMPGPIGRASAAIANMIATMRADGVINTLRSSLMRFVKMHPALVGMGLVAGAIGIAYKTNFLGIGDAIDNAVGKIKGIADAMRNAFRGAGGEAAIAEDQVASLAKATHVMDGVTVYTAFRSNADGELEAVGEIIESYANADGTTAQVLIDGEDGQYWATIDLATGEISNAEISVDGNITPFHERVNASLEVLRSAFESAGIGWAADIVGNLQGVVTFIGEMVGRIRSFFSGLGAVFSSLGLDRFAGLFSTLATQIGTAIAVLAPLGAGIALIVKSLGVLSPILTIVTTAFKVLGAVVAFLTSPIGIVVAAVAALAAGAVYAYKNFEPFRKVVDRVAKALSSFARNQAARFLRDLGGWIADAASAAADFLRGLNDILRPMDRLRSVGSTVGGLLVSAFNAVRNSAGTIGGVISPIVDHFRNLIDLAQSLWDVLTSMFSGDWSGAWDSLKEAGSNAIDVLISGFTALPRTIINAFQAVDWGAVWDGLRNAASSAIGWVLDAIRNIDWGALIQGGWNVIRDGISAAWDAITSLNWSDFIPDFGAWADWIGHKLSSAYSWGIGAFGSWATWIGHKLGDLAAWGIGKFGDWADWVGHKLSDLAAWGIGKFGKWSDWLTHKIEDITGWGIADFDGWDSFITDTLSDWADWGIEAFAGWSEWISDVEWPDWLEGFIGWLGDHLPEWPSATQLIDAIVDRLSGDSDDGWDQHEGQPDPFPGGTELGFGGGSFTANFQLQGGLPAPPALMADIENMRASLQGLVDFNDQSWQTVATDVDTGSGEARLIAAAEFAQMAAAVPPHAASIRSRVGTDFRSMHGDVSSESASARSAATGEFDKMGSSTASLVATMSRRVASDFGSMQRTASSESSSTNRTTTSEISSMNTAVSGHMLGMRTSSAVQMGLMASTAQTQGSATSNNLTGWISGAVVRVSAGMMSFVSTIRSAGGAMQEAGRYAGSMAGAGVVAGLRGQLGAVRGAANQIIAEVDRAMRRAGEISSPSRITTYIGEMLGMGPVVGMLSKIRDVKDASERLMEAATPSASGQPWELGLSPLGGGSGMGRGGTTVVDNSTHTTEYIALTQSDFMQLLRKSERGNEAYRHLSDPDSYNYGGGI